MLPQIKNVSSILTGQQNVDCTFYNKDDLGTYNELNEVKSKYQLHRQLVAGSQYKKNFHIKIQSTQALREDEYQKLQDVLQRLQSQRQIIEEQNQLRGKKSPNSYNMKKAEDSLGRKKVLKAKIHQYSYLQMKRRSIIEEITRNRKNGTISPMNNYDPYDPYQEFEQNQQIDNKNQVVTYQMLKQLKNNLEPQDPLSQQSNTSRIKSEPRQTLNQDPFKVALKNLSIIKQQEISNIILDTARSKSIDLKICESNSAFHPDHEEEISAQKESPQFKGYQPNDVLENNIQYNFKINTFNDDISFAKEIQIEPKLPPLNNNRSFVHNSKQPNNLTTQNKSNLKLKLNQNSSSFVKHNYKSPRKVPQFKTMLSIEEQSNFSITNQKRTHKQKIKDLKIQMNPIFSGSFNSYDYNAITQSKIRDKRSELNLFLDKEQEEHYHDLRLYIFGSLKKNQQSNYESGSTENRLLKKFQSQQDTKNELPIIKVLVKKNSFTAGFKPTSRQLTQMVFNNGRYYLFGGNQGQNLFNDFKQLDYYKHEWSQLQKDDPSNKIQRRYGHTMVSYLNYIIVFGGGGQMIKRIHRRETYNDIFLYDTYINKWYNGQLEDYLVQNEQKGRKSIRVGSIAPNRRMNHASCMYGGIMVSYGGIYGEDNLVLNDFGGFDVQYKDWVQLGQKKKGHQIHIPALAYHSLTSVIEYDIPHDTKDSRFMWIWHPKTASNKEHLTFQSYGMLLFGGLNTDREPQNHLYQVRPSFERNKKYLNPKTSEYKNFNKIKLKLNIQRFEPSGKPPCPRYMHSTSFIKTYLVIFGGRNDRILAEAGNVALNDLHIYDVSKNTWAQIAIFGEYPQSRWGHVLTSEGNEQTNKILLFGGVNLQSYCDASLYEFTFDDKQVAIFVEECESKIKYLKEELKRERENQTNSKQE